MKSLGTGASVDDREAENALAAVDAWRGLPVSYATASPAIASPSHRGVGSQRWIVAAGGPAPSHFLKILHPDQDGLVDLSASFAAAESAAVLGCTPKPLHVAPERRAIIFDLLPAEWRTARMDDLRQAAVLEKAIVLKKAIHGAAPFASTWSVFDRLRTLDASRKAASVSGPADLWWMLDCVGDIEQAIAANGHDARPSHADGLASNIMIGPGGAVQLVDFDEARNVDPFYEIGILLNEAFQFESEMEEALEIFEGAFRQTSLNRCRIYAIADDMTWGLWGLLMDATSPRREVEFLKYAQWRLLRCRMALRHPRFEEMLRRL